MEYKEISRTTTITTEIEFVYGDQTIKIMIPHFECNQEQIEIGIQNRIQSEIKRIEDLKLEEPID